MAPGTVRFVVCTPHEVVFDAEVRSVRVPTETGHVGIRPRMEALVLPVEAGLLLVCVRTRASHSSDRPAACCRRTGHG